MTDVFPQKFLADKLRDSDLLKGRAADVDKIASILSGIRGVRLGAKIGARCYAKLVVDLQDDAAPLSEIAKPLILNALDGAGALLDDMQDWKPSVGKQSVALEGYLSDDGLRVLMGLVEIPDQSVAMVDSAAPAAAPQTEESLVREASLGYFKAIQGQVDSLRLQKKEAKTHGHVAMFVDNAARRINRMSTLIVDPELAEFGGTVASGLRQISAQLKGIGIRSGARQAGIYSDDSYYYDDSSNVQSARRDVRAQEKAAGATSTIEIVQQIADQSAAMRRKMTDRYKVQF